MPGLPQPLRSGRDGRNDSGNKGRVRSLVGKRCAQRQVRPLGIDHVLHRVRGAFLHLDLAREKVGGDDGRAPVAVDEVVRLMGSAKRIETVCQVPFVQHIDLPGGARRWWVDAYLRKASSMAGPQRAATAVPTTRNGA